MHNYFPLMLPVVFVLVTIQYLLEVHLGSATSMYDVELGLSSAGGKPRKSSHGQFLGRAAPMQLAAIGSPLLAYNLLSGVLLILVALFLFCLYRENSSASAERC